ncbi:facilitated trehalose transporter Tret1-like [Photinus pyralis]|uniref:facilitated trehalose transporter Tret1-like n=1 Tax=Photinus pyralis TaxID=7054 RepID=UPI0012672042|nr:facilitated trehalose transporter Tret1-like [Photinus pyralis]
MARDYLTMTIAGLSSMSSGMHYGWTSTALPQIVGNNSHIPTTSEDEYWISVSYFGGSLIASALVSLLIRYIGQKGAIILATLLLIISWVIIACAQSIAEIIIARIFSGAGDAILLCALTVYVAEISKPSIRGFFLSSMMVYAMFGILAENVIGTFFAFRTCAIISAVLPSAVFLCLFFVPESPYRLVSKGNMDGARTALTKLRNTDVVDDELERILSMIYDAKVSVDSYLELFTSSYNRRTVYICFTLISVHVFSGNIVFIFHTQEIFQDVGGPLANWISSLIYLTAQLIFTLVGLGLVDKYGRRPLLLISTAGVTLSLAIESVYFYLKDCLHLNMESLNFVPLLGMMLFLLGFSVGLQIIPVVISGELFAPNVKFFALSLYEGYFCVISVVGLKLFQISLDAYGLYAPFLLFTLCAFFGFLFVYYFVPETKQKTLEEIQMEIVGKDDRLICNSKQ